MLCKWSFHHADKPPQIVRRNPNVFQVASTILIPILSENFVYFGLNFIVYKSHQ